EILLYMAVSSQIQTGSSEEHDDTVFWTQENLTPPMWKPCSSPTELMRPQQPRVNATGTGFILVSASGGLNQQRVAVCNAVAVASMLDATLVIPRFRFSKIWKDSSQFGDIYQEETFMSILKDDVNIVKDLPSHLKSLKLKAIGSVVTGEDLPK
ncbi:hypothetical protein M569_14972, partial [Genlisea aurea]